MIALTKENGLHVLMGSGDVCVTSGGVKDRKSSMIGFKQAVEGNIGRDLSDKESDALDRVPHIAIIEFTDTKSIDIIINQCKKAKTVLQKVEKGWYE